MSISCKHKNSALSNHVRARGAQIGRLLSQQRRRVAQRPSPAAHAAVVNGGGAARRAVAGHTCAVISWIHGQKSDCGIHPEPLHRVLPCAAIRNHSLSRECGNTRARIWFLDSFTEYVQIPSPNSERSSTPVRFLRMDSRSHFVRVGGA